MRKKKQNSECSIINAQHVFAKNNQVSIKLDKNIDKWYPINFQWVPTIELQHDMKKK